MSSIMPYILAPSETSPDSYGDAVGLINSIGTVPSILEVVCQATGMGFAAVARVTEDRWIACSVRDTIEFGLQAGGELDITTTICHEIREHREIVVIDDVDADPVYAGHHTPALYGLKSYISMPIVLSDGHFFGTLCAIDPRPAHVSQPHVIGMFRLFAKLIAQNIETHQQLAAKTTDLIGEQQTSALREQFIAVLGHDLRNPLAGISGAVRYLEREKLTERGNAVLAMVHQTVERMGGLIDNVMDFARGRLGGGITLERCSVAIEPVLRQVINELRVSSPDRVINAQLDVPGMIDCDPVRIGQLFSNLLGNALTHGASDAPIRAIATIDAAHFELRTINQGDPIPPEAMRKLFAPFARGEVRPSLQGLGLGLYIASEIARAHGGTLTATSDANETAFIFRVPLRGA
ncbi:GAF domain-containing sensor histidine kinase [Novosphingobium sp.]|uniref:GAF domain-containing sensor histidine kinase n=1 Tax=Novosphingobium sp. TaxID=1874826 RepID=UPI003B52A866